MLEQATLKKRKMTLIIIIVLFCLVLFFIEFAHYDLEKHGILLNAKTSEWILSTKMGMDLKYEFYYEGEKIISSNAFEKFRGNRDFEGKYFPVMYDPKFKLSQLLIEPSDFKNCNLKFPDSLKWVLSYLK